MNATNALTEKTVQLNLYYWLAILSGLNAVANKDEQRKERSLAEKSVAEVRARILSAISCNLPGDQVVAGKYNRCPNVNLVNGDWTIVHAALEEWILSCPINAAIDAEITQQISVEPQVPVPAPAAPKTLATTEEAMALMQPSPRQ